MKHMDHGAYQRRVRDLGADALLYAIKDCLATIEVYPDGENAGYYQDEIHYCTAELRRRNKSPR